MHLFNRFKVIILAVSVSTVLVFLLVLNYSWADWQTPQANPPNENVPAPVNVGSANQLKYDVVNGGGDGGGNDYRFGAKELVALSKVRANQYCNLIGENCKNIDNIGSGGIVGSMRSRGINILPAPTGLSEWPDYIACPQVGNNFNILPLLGDIFNGIMAYNNTVSYYNFSADGNVYTFDKYICSFRTNQLGQPIAEDILGICRKGYCGFYDGSVPLVDGVAPPRDGDGDGVPDSSDNCPVISNPDQSDRDNDGIGGLCDAYPSCPTPQIQVCQSEGGGCSCQDPDVGPGGGH